MSRGPKAVALDLSEGASELRRLLRRHGTGQALAQRVRIILACAARCHQSGRRDGAEGEPPDGGAVACSLRHASAGGIGRCPPLRCPAEHR